MQSGDCFPQYYFKQFQYVMFNAQNVLDNVEREK